MLEAMIGHISASFLIRRCQGSSAVRIQMYLDIWPPRHLGIMLEYRFYNSFFQHSIAV
jgi:hypothetical protein